MPVSPSLISDTGVETNLAERHNVESVATAIELPEEVAVGVMRRVVHLQLTAKIPV